MLKGNLAPTIAVVVLAVVGFAGLPGCGPPGPKTYTVNGKVEVPSGDPQPLAGNTVEAMLDSDPTVRASGEIKADGSFTLETLHQGVILKGAQEGTYQVRIILSEDGDAETRRLSRAAVHPRFTQFKTSGLSFQVPPPGEVTLKVTPRDPK